MIVNENNEKITESECVFILNLDQAIQKTNEGKAYKELLELLLFQQEITKRFV